MSQARTPLTADGNATGATSTSITGHAVNEPLPKLPRSQHLASVIAGVCAGVIVVSTAVLMMPTPAMAAGPAAGSALAPNDGDDVPALRLQRFALNAMLVPVMDDTVPARWTRNISAMRCGKASRVFVDGKPMRPGAVVPSKPFTLTWSMVDCHPMGTGESFNGNVKLTVIPENDGYSAMVVPTGLKVTTLDSSAVWNKTFAVGLTDQP